MGTVTTHAGKSSCDEHIRCRINNPGPDIVALISAFQPDIVALISAFSGDLSKECISKSNPLRSSVRDSKSEPPQTPRFSARITKVESKIKLHSNIGMLHYSSFYVMTPWICSALERPTQLPQDIEAIFSTTIQSQSQFLPISVITCKL